MAQDLYEQLLDRYPAIAKAGELNNNEQYIEIDSAYIVEMCTFVHHPVERPLVSLFASDERGKSGGFALYYVFALISASSFLILKAVLPEGITVFPSITRDIHAAHLYEREIKDMFGLMPEGHPDAKRMVFHGNWPEGLYPLRKDYDAATKPNFAHNEQQFTRVDGTGVYEIPVGPVHAGIIEPGHFRFSVAGEPIINLEAQLYFVHKGIEKLSEGCSIEKGYYISERISGDETYTNSLAYCQAIERIAGLQVPRRAEYSRVFFAELERLICHFGDLAGICLDVAYGFGAYHFRMLRGWCYQLTEPVCQSRFLRSVNMPGGVRKDFIAGNEELICEYMLRIKKELCELVKIMKANSLFIDRVENTGVLDAKTAADFHAVGPAGRASGIRGDMRVDFPYAAYDRLNISIPEHNNGDVNCRMNVKLEECFQAIDLIRQVIEAMSAGPISVEIGELEPYRYALGYTEAPRGENLHWVMTGENNTIFRYKIRTPSFCNWPALCKAVNGNIVPDFPLINKSFNLSYAGNDL